LVSARGLWGRWQRQGRPSCRQNRPDVGTAWLGSRAGLWWPSRGQAAAGGWLAWDGRGAAHHPGGRAACSARPSRPRAAAQSRPRGTGVTVEAAGAALAATLRSLPRRRPRCRGCLRCECGRRAIVGGRPSRAVVRLGGGRARDEARTCSRPHACSRRRGRRARPSCGGRARVTAPAGGGEPRACSQSTTSSPAKAGAVKWSTRARSTRGSGGWLELTHVDGRCARCV